MSRLFFSSMVFAEGVPVGLRCRWHNVNATQTDLWRQNNMTVYAIVRAVCSGPLSVWCAPQTSFRCCCQPDLTGRGNEHTDTFLLVSDWVGIKLARTRLLGRLSTHGRPFAVAVNPIFCGVTNERTDD